MNTTHTLRHTILGIVLTSLLALSPAQAETTNCTAITSLPFTISTQGVYCFTGNLGTSITSGNAITINANNVTLDMNGFKLGGLAAGVGTTANGIYAPQRKNITIKNGIIRGFYRGIYFNDNPPYTTSQGHVVSGIFADQSTYVGIWVEGRGNTLQRNQVLDTGGSTASSIAVGIHVYGPNNDILDNMVSVTTASGSSTAYGIKLFDADIAVVQGNRVSEVTSGGGFTRGIYMGSGSDDVIVRNNLIRLVGFGIYYAVSTGLYGGNYTSNVTTPFTGGMAAGSTNYTNP